MEIHKKSRKGKLEKPIFIKINITGDCWEVFGEGNLKMGSCR
jgi:hypothetical protein